MKRKYSNYRTAMVSILILIVAFGFSPLVLKSQENDPPLFALVDFMKVKPDNEGKYLELEKNIFNPLHAERAKLVKSELWEVVDSAFAQ